MARSQGVVNQFKSHFGDRNENAIGGMLADDNTWLGLCLRAIVTAVLLLRRW